MRRAGIREARQNLAGILEEVRRGREIVITDRGRPVARIIPPRQESMRPFSSHRRFRGGMRLTGEPLSKTVARDREDRL